MNAIRLLILALRCVPWLIARGEWTVLALLASPAVLIGIGYLLAQ
jgi:hypothetical protein